MTHNIIATMQRIVNEIDPETRMYLMLDVNNYILELEKPKTCEGCSHSYYRRSHGVVMPDLLCNISRPVVDSDGYFSNERLGVANYFYCSDYTPKDQS